MKTFHLSLFAALLLPIAALGREKIELVNAAPDYAHPGIVKVENDEGLYCTAEVVGLHPTTLLTAAHCAKDGFTTFRGLSPSDTYTMSKGEDDSSRDIAVLMYKDADLTATLSDRDIFSVAPIRLGLGDSITLCGFGMTSPYDQEGDESDGLRCGMNQLSAVGGKFAPLTSFQAPFSAADFQFVSATLTEAGSQLFNLIVTIADQGVLGPHYDSKVGNNGGDSGGAWFTADQAGLSLAGISSWGEALKSGGSLSNYIYMSVALELNSSDVKLTLKNASEQRGADIRGLATLLSN